MEEIKKKGFNMVGASEKYQIPDSAHGYVPVDFSKIKVGLKTISDATLRLGDLQKVNPQLASKGEVMRAIYYNNLDKMREISNYFYKISGIYQRLCRYMAYMYRYDWLVTPYYDNKNANADQILKGFNKVLSYLDDFGVKKFFGEVALKVVRNGCYYGYMIKKGTKVTIQELPVRYCRSRFIVEGRPVVEFNMRYFDDMFSDTEQKNRVLKIFPPEFSKGYKLYCQNKLKPDYLGDDIGWYVLDPKSTLKFNLNG